MKRLIAIIIVTSVFFNLFIILNLQPIKAATEDFSDWNSDERLSFTPEESYRPDIAVDSKDNIHVVWHDENESGGIFYKKFNGISWSNKLLLNPNATIWGSDPSIAIDSHNNIHIAYSIGGYSPEIEYVKFDGNSWSDPEQITFGSGYDVGWSPNLGPRLIIDSNDHLYVFWTDHSSWPINGWEISYVYYNGDSWSSKQYATLDIGQDTDHFNPIVALDSIDNIHLVYTTTTPTGEFGFYYDTYYKKFDGNSWSTEKMINNVRNFTVFPSIAVDSKDNIHIVWSDARDHPGTSITDLYYSKFDNNGYEIIDNLKLTDEPESASYHDIIIDSFDNIHIVRQNQIQDSFNCTIWYLKLSKKGEVLNDLYLRNSYHKWSHQITCPRIDIDSSNQVHVVCGDNSDGNLEVYYKSSNTHDLWFLNNDISLSDSKPMENDEVTINAKIHNYGLDLTNVKVNFYCDSISTPTLISSTSLNVPKDDLNTASVKWQAIQGEHKIIVVIDPNNEIKETDENNNIFNKTIYVTPLPRPSIIITLPINNATISGMNVINTVTSNTTNVEFYLNSDLKHTDNDSPFNWEWDTKSVLNGNYIIKVIAYDAQEQEATDQININIDNPPDITPPKILSEPLATVSETRSEISWETDEASNSIVEYGINSVSELKESDSQYATMHSIILEDLQSRTKYYFRVKSSDISNNEMESDVFTFNTLGDDTIEPEIEIISPESSDIISGLVNITLNVTDNDAIDKIEIYIDNDLETTLYSTPFIWSWDTTEESNGLYTLKIVAFDAYGNEAEKEIDIIIENPNLRPVVKIDSPIEGETVSGIVEIKGTAEDYDGEIIHIEIKMNGDDWEVVDETEDWDYIWDSTEKKNGNCIINIRSYDGINYSDIESINVIVKNKTRANTSNDGLMIILFIIFIVIIMSFVILITRKFKKLIHKQNDREVLEVEIIEENEK